MSNNNITNVLTKASEYRKNQLKDKNAKWITVGMISDTHTMLKGMANFYGLSLAITLRIIVRNSFKEFEDKQLDKKGDKNGNS
jgi:hypothetical protein